MASNDSATPSASPTANSHDASSTYIRELEARLAGQTKRADHAEQSRDDLMLRNLDYAAKYEALIVERDDYRHRYIESLSEVCELRSRVEKMEDRECEQATTMQRVEGEKKKLEGFIKHDTTALETKDIKLKAAEFENKELKNLIALPSRKRTASDDGENLPIHKKRKVNEVIACTQCFTKGWACDAGEPCENCIVRGKQESCKRVMCKHFKKDTCNNMHCKLAHEGDRLTKLVGFTRLKQMDAGPSPVEKIKQQEERTKGAYDDLFEQVAKKTEKKNGGRGKDGKGGMDRV